MRQVLGVCAAAAAIAASVPGHLHLRAQRAQARTAAEHIDLPAEDLLVIASLGYREALADLVWIRAVLFVGDPKNGRDWQTIAHAIAAIERLAPRFRRPYVWGSVSYVYTGTKRIDRPMIDRAIDVTRRGLAQFPEDHELLFMLGMLLLRDVQVVEGYSPDERALATREGADRIRQAAAFGAPPLIRQYAATLIADGNVDELAAQFLEAQLLQVEDEHYRRLLLAKLRAAGAEDRASDIERLRAELRQERSRTLPYVPEDLYLLLR